MNFLCRGREEWRRKGTPLYNLAPRGSGPVFVLEVGYDECAEDAGECGDCELRKFPFGQVPFLLVFGAPPN